MGKRRKSKKRVAGAIAKPLADRLAPFLKNNPEAKLIEIGSQQGIVGAWGDRSVAFIVPSEPAEFIDTINQCYLPPRYSAIWHRDTKDFEILWTAFARRGPLTEVDKRAFTFNFRDHKYACEFSRSSDRVSILAKNFLQINQTETGYRNLDSFKMHALRQGSQLLLDRLGEPYSFWIRNVDWNDEEILALALHLNFYLTYFDTHSPIIRIHAPANKYTWQSPTRYCAGAFPKNINSQNVDTNVMFLWEAASEGDTQRRFLYYYRVIEYCSSFYLDSATRHELRVALAQPNALDDLAVVTENVVAAVQKMKLDEAPRFEAMLREIIQPSALFREISRNMNAFTADAKFDGGFVLPQLVATGRTEASFIGQDVTNFAYAIRNLRNALSHGRDQKTAATIVPTAHNFAILRPWVGLAAFAASQVIIFKGIF